MTTNVIDLTARLPQTPAPCGCTRHQFEAVMERAQSKLGDSLLIGRDALEAVIADIGVTLEAVLTSRAGAKP